MDNFRFINRPDLFNPINAFLVHLCEIKTEEQLFNELNSKFEFPGYFGHNWNAVYDCLRDFHWVKQKKIILIHDALPLFSEKTLCLYIQILVDVVNDWKVMGEHDFEVVFPKDSQKIISKYLN